MDGGGDPPKTWEMYKKGRVEGGFGSQPQKVYEGVYRRYKEGSVKDRSIFKKMRGK